MESVRRRKRYGKRASVCILSLSLSTHTLSHTHTYRFEAPHSIFRKDPYVRNVDTDTKLFVMLGSLTHMIPFVLGLSSMSLLSRRHTNGEKICDQSFFLVSSFCTVLPFTFFLCTFAVLKMCFESQQGIIYELGHCFFTGSGGDAFAWMASSSVRDTCSLPSLTHSLTYSLFHTHTHTHTVHRNAADRISYFCRDDQIHTQCYKRRNKQQQQ